MPWMPICAVPLVPLLVTCAVPLNSSVSTGVLGAAMPRNEPAVAVEAMPITLLLPLPRLVSTPLLAPGGSSKLPSSVGALKSTWISSAVDCDRLSLMLFKPLLVEAGEEGLYDRIVSLVVPAGGGGVGRGGGLGGGGGACVIVPA